MKAKQKLAAKGGAVGGVVAAILGAVFYMEGGYVNNPRDPGGETNHGITQAVAKTHKEVLVTEYGWDGSMKGLSKEMAAEIYIDDYVLKPNFVAFAYISPAVTHKLVDAGVNTGVTRPAKWLQLSLNEMSRNGKDYPKIQVDGKSVQALLMHIKHYRKNEAKLQHVR